MTDAGVMWTAFLIGGLCLFVVDLLVFGRGRTVSMREAATWSIVWFTAGIAFTGAVWAMLGAGRAGEYLAGYLIERSLSIDNIFVFALIFGYFAVPAADRARVLFWGIVGALVLRTVMIFAGIALIDRFHWVMYVFGVFLVLTGIKMAVRQEASEVHPEDNPVLRLARRVIPISDRYHGHDLFTRVGGRWVATPLFAVLIVVATTDIVFAVDSIPAIFAITTDPFIVLAANVFALLGLRALYSLLEGMIDRFAYLQLGLATVLGFVGAKMLLADVLVIPTWLSLLVVITTLVVAVAASERRDRGLAKVAETFPNEATRRERSLL